MFFQTFLHNLCVIEIKFSHRAIKDLETIELRRRIESFKSIFVTLGNLEIC